ncbi:hypothetical protein F5X99DRAFT_412384 [Biscogniauxia marginata]|nr:hypothetical protein F5X99DRAFT_412384 [Biscogniauxia marginata]
MAPSSTPWLSGSPSKRHYSQYVQKPRRQLKWEVGDIAFLRDANEFNAEDHDNLIGTNYLHISATCHPVIILGRSADYGHYLVTTISAYSSGPGNNYLPPWEQACHSFKPVDGFRAFEGSARPSSSHRPYLRLADGMSCPKIRTSWVYIHHVSIVPARTLKIFDKAPRQLRMTPESLADLLDHMQAKSRKFRTEISDPRLRASSHELSDADHTNSRSNNTPKQVQSVTRQPWRKPVNWTPASAPKVSGMPTPPSSCPSSPDIVKSQPRKLASAPKLPTPPPSPQAPVPCKPAPTCTENAPNSSAHPHTNENAGVPSWPKPLWSTIAASGLAAAKTSPADPVSIPVTPRGQQQQQKQKQHRALPRQIPVCA